ncbi:MAG: WXG100 family type VII secretion target [Anaerolineae bacterium]|jgi:WXG100 family type VII secretion target|nr:WXG100 family type VII secretion target [Anaerolineae bacterium]
MPNDIIQVKYDELENIAKMFQAEQERIQEVRQSVKSKAEELRHGWIGMGSDAFFEELEGEVLPRVNRLIDALGSSSQAVYQIIEVMQAAEQEASGQFNNGGPGMFPGGGMSGPGGAMPGGFNSGGNDGPNMNSPYRRNIPGTNGSVPLFVADITDPNFNMDQFVRDINPDGRPIVVTVHGYGAHDGSVSAGGGYEMSAQWYEQTYGHLPADQRPILIGYAWDATGGPGEGVREMIGSRLDFDSSNNVGLDDHYARANHNSLHAGNRFAEMVESINYHHPEANVNVVAHSLGNRVVMEGIASGDLQINSYLAVQAAVDLHQVDQGGRYQDVLNPREVYNMGATYSPYDLALETHEVFRNSDAVGQHADRLADRREIRVYDFGQNPQWNENHYNYHDVTVENGQVQGGDVMNTIRDFFGPDGRGFR